MTYRKSLVIYLRKTIDLPLAVPSVIGACLIGEYDRLAKDACHY